MFKVKMCGDSLYVNFLIWSNFAKKTFLKSFFPSGSCVIFFLKLYFFLLLKL
jgi:hypothetical protein